MNGKKLAAPYEKTNQSHKERIIHQFDMNNEKISFVMTKHGHYRILENREITPEAFANHLRLIGDEEFEKHFKLALEKFPLKERQHIEWEKQIDYTIGVYDTVHELVVILGLHPHLKRVTIVTIVPRIENVYANVFEAYRINNEKTENLNISYKLPEKINLKIIKDVKK